MQSTQPSSATSPTANVQISLYERLQRYISSNYKLRAISGNANNDFLTCNVHLKAYAEFLRFSNVLFQNKIPMHFHLSKTEVCLHIDIRNDKNVANLEQVLQQRETVQVVKAALPNAVNSIELFLRLIRLLPRTIYSSASIVLRREPDPVCQVKFTRLEEARFFVSKLVGLACESTDADSVFSLTFRPDDARVMQILEQAYKTEMLDPYRDKPGYDRDQYFNLYLAAIMPSIDADADADLRSIEDSAASSVDQQLVANKHSGKFPPEILPILHILANRIVRAIEKQESTADDMLKYDGQQITAPYNTIHVVKSGFVRDLFCAVAYLSLQPITIDTLRSMIELFNRALEPERVSYHILCIDTGPISGAYNTARAQLGQFGRLFPPCNPGTVEDIETCRTMLQNLLENLVNAARQNGSANSVVSALVCHHS